MRAPTFRSSSRQGRALPEAVPLVARPRRPASGERAAGAVFPLAGLAIAAAATIAVFFGVGLAGLLEHPSAVVGSAPAGAAAPESPPPLDASHRAALLPQSPATAALSASPAAAPTPPTGTPSPPQATPKAAAPSPVAEPQAPPPETPAPAAAPRPVASASAAPPPQPAAPQPAAPPAVAPPPTVPPAVAPSPTAPSPPAAAAPAKSAPAPAPAARAQTLSPAEIAALLAAGDAAFRRGDLAAARVSYRRVYEAGEGRGALGMGASYDPLFLQHFHLTREHADPAEARTWYQRAKTLGAAEAVGRLDRLAGKPSP